MAEKITFEIVKKCGVISEGNNGWTKELNMVSWNGKAPKYDLRDWSEDHTKMGKGLTLTEEELVKLGELIEEVK